MRIKKVNRYYCDHCKKSGGSSYHLKRHEDGCTLNPNRVCGVCSAHGLTQQPMKDLIAVLGQDATDHFVKQQSQGRNADEEAVDAIRLRELTEGCPACILAAIRQRKPQLSVRFIFADENTAFWAELESARKEAEHDRNIEIANGLAASQRLQSYDYEIQSY